MNVQSFSIVVPNKECINSCPFCVSKMVNSNIYPNLMDISHPTYDYNVREYMKRMKHVASLGCKTLMLTGTSEPQQNKQFLNTFAFMHKLIGSPFTCIEMQTTGRMLDNANYLRFLKNFVGIDTIALSINSPCDDENNRLLNGGLDVGKPNVRLEELTGMLKAYGFNIRLCFNLSNYFMLDDTDGFFDFCKKNLHGDQVTFRKLYASDDDTEQSAWIKENEFPVKQLKNLKKYLDKFEVVGKTIYGSSIRYVKGMSVIFDTDCMGKKPKDDNTLKYLILRPNCKLYSSWDDPASLVM